LIERNVQRASEEQYDLIVVGGGIHGVCLAMEAARRGLHPLLLERDDFGGGTSWNSLRILHGGLRYLQSLDLPRFVETAGERRWFCRTYPELVEPLECLMPLYGNGLRRPVVLRAALALNDALTWSRNAGVQDEARLPAGRVLDRESTLSRSPTVDARGLLGGAVWYDVAMTCSPRVLMETLRWACRNGARALNYVECVALSTNRDHVSGVEAVERLSGEAVRFRAPVVVNCAGPWTRSVAERLDRDHEALFRPSLAFNLLLDRKPPGPAALAVAPRRSGARTYFIRPWRDRILAGTFHAPCSSHPCARSPSEEQIELFVRDLRDAVPALELHSGDVLRVYSGLLPAKKTGIEDLSSREVVIDHAGAGGPRGLWSVSGVKYTTARRVAERTLRRIFRAERDLGVRPGTERGPSVSGVSFDDPSELEAAAPEAGRVVRQLVDQEAVVSMEDLLLRRTDWGADPRRLPSLTAALGRLLGSTLPPTAIPHPVQVGMHDR
jgi:glycerol-3-phosphate dehydrogenase